MADADSALRAKLMIFAYGSLVNPAARPKELGAIEASLSGWSREWGHRISTPHGNVCALTVVQDTAACIRGVVLAGNDAEHFEIDEREIGYERIPVTVRKIGGNGESLLSCSLYVGTKADHGAATREYPIWRSYLDCILGGYLMLGGLKAVEDFVKSTRGWPAPILDDRDSPMYPRAVCLTSREKDLIDSVLRRYLLLSDIHAQQN